MSTDATPMTPSVDGLIKLLANRTDEDKIRVLGTLASDLFAKPSCDPEIRLTAPDGSTIGYLVPAQLREQAQREQELIAELDRRMKSPGRISTPAEVMARIQATCK